MRRFNVVRSVLLGAFLVASACRDQTPEPPPTPPPVEGELSTEEVLAELEQMDHKSAALRQRLEDKRKERGADDGGRAKPQEVSAATAASDLGPIATAWIAGTDVTMRSRGRCLAAYAACSGDGATLDACVRDLPQCSALGATATACCPAECINEYGRQRRGGASQSAAADATFLSARTACADQAVTAATRRNREATRTTSARPIPATLVDDEVRRAAGAPVVVAVFASWCPACRKTMPGVSDFLARHPEVRPLLVSVDHDDAALRKYLKETALPGVRILGPPKKEGGLAGALQMVGVIYPEKLPFLALLDEKGGVMGQWTGAHEGVLEETLAKRR